MKKKFTFKFMLLLCALVMGTISAWADTYSMWLDSGTKNGTRDVHWTSNNATLTHSNVSWSASFSGGSITNSNYYVQIGSKNSPFSTITLSTSDISGTISEVKVGCGAYNSNATVAVTIGGNAFGGNAQTVGGAPDNSTPCAQKTFSGSASGEIVITITNGSNGRAGYIDYVSVTYTSGSSPVDPTITFNDGSVNVDKTLDLVTLFSSNSTGAVTYSITSGSSYASLDGSVITGVAEGSVTVQASQAATASYNSATVTATITVNPALVLSSIAVTTAPTKTTYNEGETFDPTGMIVTATYTDNSQNAVTGYTCSPDGALTTDDTEITISYTESGVTRTATQAITVNAVVDYATLPFGWLGGPSTDFEALNGTSTHGLGSDYTGNNYGIYQMKFDGTGDYIQIKTDSRPGVVTIDALLNGSATSYITVQASSDGETFDDVEQLAISGSQYDVSNLVTTRTFASDVRYVRLYFTKNGSNVGVGPISIAQYVEKYAVSIADGVTGGTIECDKATAAEDEIVGLTATPGTHYIFSSWSVYKTGDSETTVDVTSNQFTMPNYPVTVSATFEPEPVYTITTPDNVSVDAPSHYAGEKVTITVTPPTGKLLLGLTVMGNTSSNAIPLSPTVSSAVTEYIFTMPVENVTITATFGNKYIVTYSVNGNTTAIASQEVIPEFSIDVLPAPDPEYVPSNYTFLGWTADDSSTASILTGSYTPTASVTLYAVFGKQKMVATSMTIDKDTEGFPTSYGTANNFEDCILNGKSFKIQQAYVNSSNVLQFRAKGNKNGTGIIYNDEDFGTITSIVLNYNASDSNKNFTIKAGSSANPTGGTEITPSPEGSKYTFDLSGGSYTYFVLTNGDNAGYLNNIIINYTFEQTVYYTLVKDVTGTETMGNIYGTYLVTVKNDGMLTLTGTNSGTIANLIIENRGQFYTESAGVNATVQKSITGYGSNNSTGWNFIASPLSANTAPSAVVGLEGEQISDDPVAYNYDLYRMNDTEWENYHEHYSDGTNPFNALVNGQGYLYAKSSNVTLEFAGAIKPYDAKNNTVGLEEGWNLVGNPYTFNVYSSSPYYKITTTDGVDAITVVEEAGEAIAPCTGIVVEGTSSITSVAFTTSAGEWATGNNGNLQMVLAQNVATRGEGTAQTLDKAIVSFNEGSQLGKFYFGTQDANLYIPQDNEEYAIVSSNAQGEMPVNFKAHRDGQYTITVNPQEVEMGYLHLVDNIGGMDIDLLATPSYTFNAKADDYESRFRLVFSANMVNADLNDDFAFFSNGQLVIANEGEAVLQVIDVTGRVVATESVNGTCSKAINAKAGVYVLRLINGTDVKTQKIIVK